MKEALVRAAAWAAVAGGTLFVPAEGRAPLGWADAAALGAAWAVVLPLVLHRPGRTRRMTPGVLAGRMSAAWVLFWAAMVPAGWVALGTDPAGTMARYVDVVGPLPALLAFVTILMEQYLGLHKRYRLLEQTANGYRHRAGELRIRALVMQLHPHFLFNALNSVRTLLAMRPDDARAVFQRLIGLLERTFTHGAKGLIPLADEIAYLREYVRIEQVRFGNRLELRVEVPVDLRPVPVPALILQPLVENAVKYGIARRKSDGVITLRAAASAGRIILDVIDNGPGPDSNKAETGTGIGLSNVRARLHHQYGTDIRCQLTDGPDGGALARIEFPLNHSQHVS